MGQSTGMVGRDMLALSIQSGLAATKVSQLNQAWDQFMANITGGTGGLSQLEESIQNIGHIVTNTSNHLASSTGGMTLSAKQFDDAMTTYTGKGAQAWSNFDQIMGSTMPQLADWFRTAAAEGAISGTRLSKSILDMASTMVPFAAKSKVAQSELVAFAQSAGLNIKTFPQLEQAIKATGANAKNLESQVSATTIKMGNMAQVAQNLGDVMNSALTTAISNASLKAAGFYTATSNLTNALKTYGANSPQAEAAARAVTAAWDRAQAMAGRVASQARNAQAAINAMHGKTITINTYYTSTGSSGGVGHRVWVGGHAAGAAYTAAGDAVVGEMG